MNDDTPTPWWAWLIMLAVFAITIAAFVNLPAATVTP